MDDLDDILDSVELGDLKNVKDNGSMDLDDLLDSVADDMIASEVDIDSGLQLHMSENELQPWLNASSNVPDHLSKKWLSYLKTDTLVDLNKSRFLSSPSFQKWDSKHLQPFGLKKLTLESIRNTCVKNSLDDNKCRSVLASVSLPNGEVDDNVSVAYGTSLLRRFKSEIVDDINYNSEAFPELAEVLQKL